MIPTAEEMLSEDFITMVFPNNEGFTKRLSEPYHASNCKIIGIGAEVDVTYTSHKMYIYVHLPNKTPHNGVPYTAMVYKREISILSNSEHAIFFDMIRDSDMYKAFTAVEPEVELAVNGINEPITGEYAYKTTTKVIDSALTDAIKIIDGRISATISVGEYVLWHTSTVMIIRQLEAHYKERGFSVECKPIQARLGLKWDAESLSKLTKEVK